MKRAIGYILLGVLCAALMSVAAVFYYMKENEIRQKKSLEEQLSRVEISQEKLEKELKEHQISKSGLEERVKFQDQRIDELNERVQIAESERDKARALAEAKQSEIDQLKLMIENIEREKQELLNRLDKQYSDYYDMKFQLNSIMKTKEELEKKAKELAETGPISLGTVVVRQSAPSSIKKS